MLGTSICKNDGDENVGISQEYNSKKVGISQKSEGLKSWDIPKIGGPKKLGYPKLEAQKKDGISQEFCYLMQPKVGPGWGPKRKSAFRKTYFPHKELSLITIMERLQIMLKTYHLQDRNADNLLFSPKTYDFPLNMKSMQKS